MMKIISPAILYKLNWKLKNLSVSLCGTKHHLNFSHFHRRVTQTVVWASHQRT